MDDKLREPVVAYFKDHENATRSRQIMAFLEHEFDQPVKYVFPDSIAEFLEAINLQKELGGTAIFSGGDGLLNQGIPVIMNSSIDLLPLPGGTANDFSRESGWHPLPKKPFHLERKKIDCLEINGRPVLTVGGWGTGTIVIHTLERIRKNPKWKKHAARYGRWIYFWLAAYHSLRAGKHAFSYTITSGHSEVDSEIANALYICNQAKLGNLFHVSKTSNNSDGSYEIISAKKRNGIFLLLRGLTTLLSKSNQSWSKLVLTTTTPVTITINEPGIPDFFADGEFVQSDIHSFHVRILPEAINVIYRI